MHNRSLSLIIARRYIIHSLIIRAADIISNAGYSERVNDDTQKFCWRPERTVSLPVLSSSPGL